MPPIAPSTADTIKARLPRAIACRSSLMGGAR
jgi:hypothetical protein